jgi:diacylglycerol kinase family enzyme
MRAMLVVNPKATATTARKRDVLIRALGSDLKLDVAETRRRGHATLLAREALDQGLDLVVVLGGDGTVNEVVNGLLRDGPESEHPALAVVPGGSTNVFTRALDLPRDPVEATSVILDGLRAGRIKRIGLGRADGRYFTFTAGIGLDADAVRVVERHRRHGRRATPMLYVDAALTQFFRTDRRHPAITLERPGEEPVPGLFLGIVSNTSPWTYLGNWPVVVSPQASFETGLDLLAMRRLHVPGTVRVAAGLLARSGKGPRGRSALSLHDLDEFRLVAERPLPFQLDGDFLGERESVQFCSVPDALRVVC